MKYVVISILCIACFSCTVNPEPITYGKDACHHCRMTLMDRKFGAELVTTKGKIYKFDDVNCMFAFYHSGNVATDEFSHKLVVDFSQPAKLIEASTAFYVKSPQVQSPMGSQVAAFEKEADMKKINDQLNGIYIVWGELVTQFK